MTLDVIPYKENEKESGLWRNSVVSKHCQSKSNFSVAQ